MCTVSWVHRPDGYDLLCNRDEKRSRGAAFAPRVMDRGGVRYIAPVDSDFGGTWIAANEFGLSLCLLNGPGGVGERSRGLLMRELAWAACGSECLLWLKQLDLRPFAPFLLVVLEPRSPAVVATWDGAGLDVDHAGDRHMPLTSSSYDAEGVRRARLKEFGVRVHSARHIDPALLYRFHSSHGDAPSAYSTCMHRPDAETVSFSWVSVTKEGVRFLYSPVAPCHWET